MSLTDQCIWWQDVSPLPTPDLETDLSIDVAIVGAGFTGLWTAYFLKLHKPHWNIAVFEQHHVGYGASGRNGGWLIGGIEGQDHWLTSLPADQQKQTRELLFGIVESVKSVTEKEKIDCDLIHAGGAFAAARYPEQLNIARSWQRSHQQVGHSESDYRWLNKAEAEEYLVIPQLAGAIYSPHYATINPAKLVTGLAKVLLAKGVQIFSNARVSAIENKTLTVHEKFTVSAETIVTATEAFTNPVSKLNKKRLPIFSAVIGTKPLAEQQWQQMVKKPGLAFSDVSRSITYGQRSATNQMVFGARGGYLFGGRSQFDFSPNSPVFNAPKTYVQRLFPEITEQDISYQWAGSLAMSRRYSPYVGYDKERGLAIAGGYGGEGVGASHLLGQTLADLIAQESTQRTEQPWVCNSFLTTQQNWEPEPIPWLAYKTIGGVFSAEDYICHYNKLPWLRKPVVKASEWLEQLLH